MATDDAPRHEPVFHYENGVPVFNPERIDDLAREQEDAKKRDAKYKDDQLAVNKRLTVFTGVLAICGILAGGVSAWQAHIANQTLTEIRNSKADTSKIITASETQASAATKIAGAGDRFSKSADQINGQTQIAVGEFERIAKAAEESVKSTLDIARLEQRPWVSAFLANPPVLDVDKPMPELGVTIMNTGRTFARKVEMTTGFQFSQNILHVLPPFGDVPERSVGLLAPNSPSINRVGPTDKTSKLKDIYPQLTNDWYFTVWGEIRYEDVFTNAGRHVTKFCFYRRFPDSGPGVQCEMYNEAN